LATPVPPQAEQRSSLIVDFNLIIRIFTVRRATTSMAGHLPKSWWCAAPRDGCACRDSPLSSEHPRHRMYRSSSDRRDLRSPHDVECDGLIGLAATPTVYISALRRLAMASADEVRFRWPLFSRPVVQQRNTAPAPPNAQ
jgi:hypothetical protein